MKIVVTGAAGFIGSYTVDKLLDADFEVIGLDHHVKAGRREDVDWMLADVRDETAVFEALAHADGFIHLAACLGTQETIQNPKPAAETNILGGLNILEAAARYEVPGVYIAVGNHWMENTYSITKTTVERFCRMFNAERGTQVNVVRALNAYGPRQLACQPYGPGKVRKIMPAFVCRALSETAIEVYGTGDQVMDMIYVADVATVLVGALKAAMAGDVFDEVIEAGSGIATTVNDIAEVVRRAAEDQGTETPPLEYLPMRPGEPEHSIVLGRPETMDCLQWYGVDRTDFTSLHEGVARTVTDFRVGLEAGAWQIPS